MVTLLIIVAIYLGIGLLVCVGFAYHGWALGNDITLGEIGFLALRVPLWPIGIAMVVSDFLESRNIGDVVVIKGNRSARMLKVLRDE